MSHLIYKTEGIILKSWNLGEADRLFSFYTKDYGRINISARGVRYLKSKLRYSLSGLSLLKVAFVSTQNDHWRLVDAEELESFQDTRSSSLKIVCAGRILGLFERLVQGEEIDLVLWNYLKEIFNFLEKPNLSPEKLKDFEVFAILRMLQLLGYTVDSDEVKGVNLDEISRRRSFWVSLINDALAQSQL